ncbi:Spc98 family-domain-containing protein [Pseudomassariella vexata]|uniref:DASH complex subunit ASK1 n=1 Tax=Pseudomassariella vexata TaxID=1141098 RepID=A0A1Y2E018_9PEZI|nr:Spc98 family-domain-containing protein [Pseudomassariella vexata]ORY64888.1 Spc98 family-domain-containing protein [Pseudomassariella vexata]
MADEDDTDIFGISNFWKSSRWLDPLDKKQNEFFDLDIQASEKSCWETIESSTTEVVSDEFFKLPAALTTLNFDGQAISQDDTARLQLPLPRKAGQRSVDFFNDAWISNEATPNVRAEFKSWDGFTMLDTPPAPALFATEAGATIYDAVLSSPQDPLKIQNSDHNAIEADPYTASLLALALGRASIFFVWDRERSSFTPDLNQMRVSGYSADVLQGLQNLCITCGNITRFLSAMVWITYKTHPSPGRIALAKAVDILLVAIQTKLGSHARTIRSLLQLQSMIQPVHSILTYFKSLITKLERAINDEHLLSIIFDETQALEHGNELLSEVMREVLARVSKPWADFAQEWIGTKPESGIGITKDGPGRSFVKVENVAFMDDFGLEIEEPDYVLDHDRMPDFVPEEITRVMFETGRNLRLLRTHLPDHPLCYADNHRASESPALAWHFDWNSIQGMQKEVDEYEMSLFELVRRPLDRSDEQSHVRMRQEQSQITYELQLFGRGESDMVEHLLASIKQLNEPLPAVIEESGLSRLLLDRLLENKQGTEQAGLALTPHWSLLPLLTFGPLVEAQARLVNREYMKLLFSAHNLRAHITLQREFHLLGNGFFCTRLSHSLFDSELETAERQAGVTRYGGMMGLRLGGRDSWPPASSELRLALMGVLTESYLPPSGHGSSRHPSGEISDLPRHLSFAVRDLSDEEIDRCMDPSSLEALDFLRLSYKPPSPLTPIMTPVILVKYDRIFKLLLRVLRMLYVVSELFRDTSARTSQWRGIDNTSLRFRIEAQHFVSSITTYFFDTGIGIPWARFEDWLDKVQSTLENDDTDAKSRHVLSPDEMREYHEQVLDQIMHTLLLRKRQQPVLKLLEDIFTLILRFSKRAWEEAHGKPGSKSGTASPKELYAAFKKKVGVFITVCRGMSEKGGHTLRQTKNEATIDERKAGLKEENTIDRLLLHLEITSVEYNFSIIRPIEHTVAVIMSRAGSARNLTLTEELEKLEQSITLTLQEIDRNFSKAHRIVTTSILPLVEQYGEHSKNVWEASKFWKQFFEASANVSLSGYEEQANDEDATAADETTRLTDTTTSEDYTPSGHDDSSADQSAYHEQQSMHRDVEDSLLDDGSLAGSTPRPPATKSLRPQQLQFANLDSPYENLRRELKGDRDPTAKSGRAFPDSDDDDDTTQIHTKLLPDMSMEPHSSSILEAPTPTQESKNGRSKDPLLHRVLDRTFRIQATPHKGGGGGGGALAARDISPDKTDRTRRALWADSPQSSPEIAAPTLRTNLYSAGMSPLKAPRGLGRAASGVGRGLRDAGPRTPGVSVQTPGTARKTRDVYASDGGKGKLARDPDEIMWDSDEDEDTGSVLFGGMSPPKTIQFALPPSKLMQTPAREASKRIVEDILMTAGAAPEYGESSDYSPTMVKMNQDILDDTF